MSHPFHYFSLGLLTVFFLLPSPVEAREFRVTRISENGNARNPSIGDSGLVAWQCITTNREGKLAENARNIYIWQNGQARNITEHEPHISGNCGVPRVFGDHVVFLGRFLGEDAGHPFVLHHPQKDQTMLELESDYPDLFKRADIGFSDSDEETNAVEEASAGMLDTNALNNVKHRRHLGNADDVLLYQPNGDIKRITPGTHQFLAPVRSETAVAFLCARGWPYGYEMLTWKPGDAAITQLTTNYYYVLNPYIQGNELVYQAWDGSDYEIHLHDFTTGETRQITQNQFDDTNPVVQNGEVVWIAHPTINAEIFHYRDGTIRKLSEGSTENSAPSLWNGRAVWQGLDDGDYEIYYFDGRRTIKLTSNTWDDLQPQINNGIIAWVSYVDHWNAEIMALDLSDNIAIRLTDNHAEDILPQTAAERIVWQTVTETESYIQMAEPAAARTQPIE
ncbi:MAG: hypothetical protein LBN38_04590 [Verrucomicrobiota bacterium]|jgi:hypothetical protein|nr:hypothetical protein [Verrucomicrobiota bacterium]